MPGFNIVRKSEIQPTFRVSQVRSGFDIKDEKITETFTGTIDIEGKEWSIGLISGRSGTGKTTIVRELFGEREQHKYGERPVIDEMPEKKSFKEITYTFTSVGFSSPPSWLKPYRVLSTGEKMRVDLAYALLSDESPIIFDEFTSVVDRDVAKVCSYAIAKNIRKLGKQFIAVSCHEDIIEWLQPDWILDTNLMKFSFRARERQPEISLDIYEVTRNRDEIWEVFRKYHYLDTNLHKGAKVYVAYYKGNPVSFCSIMFFPSRKDRKDAKEIHRIHRWVTLPDYQGVGIGTALLNYVAERYKALGKDVRLVSSQVNVMRGLTGKKGWILRDIGRKTEVGVTSMFRHMTHKSSKNRITASLKYVGIK